MAILTSTACADAHGLLTEGLSPGRILRLYGDPLPIYGLLKDRGLGSDDTEHAAMTAIAFARSAGDPDKFIKVLAREMRWWLWSLPPATGLATLRALVKLSLGFPPSRSGVHSAGNGPCMRAPILGSLVDDVDQLWTLVERSSRLTHTDPQAIEGAFAVALWTQLFKTSGQAPDLGLFISLLATRCDPQGVITAILRDVHDSLSRGETPAQFCTSKGWKKGPSGYVVHTLGAVFSVIYSYGQDWETSIRQSVLLGGDTDTVAAIIAGMLGARQSPPQAWVNGLKDWPRSAAWLEQVEPSARLAAQTGQPQEVPTLPWWKMWLRNVLFLPLVLVYGVRRCLPPY